MMSSQRGLFYAAILFMTGTVGGNFLVFQYFEHRWNVPAESAYFGLQAGSVSQFLAHFPHPVDDSGSVAVHHALESSASPPVELPLQDFPLQPEFSEQDADSGVQYAAIHAQEPDGVNREQTDASTPPDGQSDSSLIEQPKSGLWKSNASQSDQSDSEGPPQSALAPEKVTVPPDAAPLKGPSDSEAVDRQKRAIIDQELPQASDEEREIWWQQLKGLSGEEIRAILRIRRQMSGQRPEMRPQAPDSEHELKSVPIPRLLGPVHDLLLQRPSEECESDRGIGETPSVPATPGSCRMQPDEESGSSVPFRPSSSASRNLDQTPAGYLGPTLAALEKVRTILFNNLANCRSVGFKRMEPVLVDLPYVQGGGSAQEQNDHGQTAIGLGMQIVGTRMDVAQGPLRRTGRPLDVAISGQGFLSIKRGDQTCYTRAGVLTLDSQRRLAVMSATGGHALHPAISLPEGISSIEISRDGIVTVRKPEKDMPICVGRIQLASFVNPSGLIPLGENFFAESAASGQVVFGHPRDGGLGQIHQGFLEDSNVDLQRELADWQRLQQLLETLDQVSRPFAPNVDRNMPWESPEVLHSPPSAKHSGGRAEASSLSDR